jgi:hypothetical protein
MDEWEVETEELKLRFEPIHAHREERDYKLVKSRSSPGRRGDPNREAGRGHRGSEHPLVSPS